MKQAWAQAVSATHVLESHVTSGTLAYTFQDLLDFHDRETSPL